MVDTLLSLVSLVVSKFVSWVDQLFGYFGEYTNEYSKYLVYALLLFIAAKIFRVNLKLGK